MKRIELHVEHSYENRFIGRHRVLSEQGLCVLGTSRDADIRLLGEQVGGIHATVEWQDGHWVLSDLGSEHGTWYQKKPIVTQQILETIVILIGKHQLRMTPVVQTHTLFENTETEAIRRKGELFHQVIVRKHQLLVNNILAKGAHAATIELDGRTLVLEAPKDEQWVIRSEGDFEIRQRLVSKEVVAEEKKEGWQGFLPTDLRTPALVSGALAMVFAALIFFMPQEPKDTMVALKPEELNQYTRMIYDAAKVKKQKAESQKLVKNVTGKVQETPPVSGGNTKVGGTAARIVNNIKSSGLTALIGKISARAAKNTDYIQTAGVAPDVIGAGAALGVGRTIGSAAPKQVGLGAGEGHKLGGVGTAGKGGGSGDYKGFGGLAVGNVGNASVGLLEEESEVDGGLDKDVIARYIKSQLGQIRYCYERQLSASPDLYGKVMIKFTIGATGAVTTQAIGASSLSNAMVEGCILRRVAGWQFPIPKGGTQVLVSYPFLFKSTR